MERIQVSITTAIRIPTVFLVIGTFSVPVWLLGWLPIWGIRDAKYLIIFLSGPLFILASVAPLLYLGRLNQQRSSIALTVISLIYFVSFGIRAYYFLLYPDVVLYPRFDSRNDLLWLHRGLLWATSGIWAMTLGYFVSRRFAARSAVVSDERIGGLLDALFETCSNPWYLFGMYGMGLVGRIYSLYSGSALWIYNSPAFDAIATRQSTILGGPLSLVADFCPLAFAGLLAYRFQDTRLAQSLLFKLVLVVILITEGAYFSFGLYKFGLLGILTIVWIVSAVNDRGWSKQGFVLALFLLFVIFPVVNSARSDAIDYYVKYLRPSAEWVTVMRESALNAYDTQSGFALRAFLDPFFERMNGAEAVAVAEKYVPVYGFEWGRTYLNLLRLVVPRFLRAWSSVPYYINWAVDYVGLAPSNPTVIPMPAIVEAFVNFGIIGVWVIMFLLGLLYWSFDRFSVIFGGKPMASGLFAYVVWRSMNIEHNLFIFLPALVKTVLVVLVISWFYHRMVEMQYKHRVSVRTR